MSNYTTVRIDNESMRKLEEIAETMEAQLNFKISKASALEHIINEEYNQIVLNPKKFILKIVNESSEEKKLEFQQLLDSMSVDGYEPEFILDEKGKFILNKK